MRRIIHLAAFIILLTAPLAADGLLVPSTTSYPSTLLRNRMTKVSVNITGVAAETVVYQEFVNEWSQSTDAVWVFPLPADARATALYYWRHDTLFQAVLKVQEQVVTPGTGGGDVPAEINAYIGKSGIKIELKGIEPWTVQRVEFHYISLCDFDEGRGVYRYPLASGNFVRHPLELVEFKISLDAGTAVGDYSLAFDGDVREARETPRTLDLTAIRSKAYITADIEFIWQTAGDSLTVDFLSGKADTTDGYYALMIRPPVAASEDEVMPKRVIFCLEQSSRMYGIAFTQTRTAILEALSELGEHDEFNLIAFESQVRQLFAGTVHATAANVQQAQTWLAGLNASGGSRLDLAMPVAMGMFAADSVQNMLIVFGSGRASITPDAVRAMNTSQAAVIMLGIGSDVDRSRMELIAERNGGFARFLPATAAMAPEISRILKSLGRLLLRDVLVEYPDINIYGIRPDPLPPMFAGLPLLTAGRYRNPGPSSMALAGDGVGGFRAYTFRVQFAGDRTQGSLAEKLWAKLMIDGMEREIDVYGVRQSLKDSLIAVSLASGMRCRYTAYIADYVNVVSDVGDEETHTVLPSEATRILGCYPNPFNPVTSIRVFIGADRLPGSGLFLAIYDMLGRLVRLIDLSQYVAGTHVISFDGKDVNGNTLPSGTYTLVLSGGQSSSMRTVVLMK